VTLDLSQTVSIVTGGSRGLGAVFAKGLAACGSTVALVARSQPELDAVVAEIRAAGGNAVPFVADVTDQVAIEAIVAEVTQRLGPIDVLINNAGIFGPIGPSWKLEPEAVWRTLEVNLRGPMLWSQAVLPGMIARHTGRIINLSSDAGLYASPFFSPYGVSKTALIRFSENLALEAGHHGIRVFSIAPGAVRTSMVKPLFTPEGQKWLPSVRNIFDQGRDVPPDQVLTLVLRLVSGDYDELTGCWIRISDDLDQMKRHSQIIRQEHLYTLVLPTLGGSVLAKIRRRIKRYWGRLQQALSARVK
jgi:NAD(P)-dependent dehydrogenase (short-subunit alcohol dehydrogenase family)